MNEMHNVINEHITDLNKPRYLEPTRNLDNRPQSTGSGSQYSRDYIAGEETDEEEETAARNDISADNIKRWSPETVSSYLQSVGVEKAHCDLFRQEEFTGEVLLEMDQAQVFMKELDLGPIGRRMKTWQKIKALQDEVKFGTVSADYASPKETTPRGATSTPPSAGTDRKRTSAAYSSVVPSSQASRRPSASSIRELGQGRRHSSNEQIGSGAQTNARQVSDRAPHGTQSSLDGGWAMASQPGPVSDLPRPASTTHLQTSSPGNTPYGSTTASSQVSVGVSAEHPEIDRGYTSGDENENRRPRRVLRKRDTSGDQHKRMSSFGSDSRRSSKGFFWQKSNRESRDEVRPMENASQQRVSQKDGVRIVSEPVRGQASPTVTRLEYDDEPRSNRQSAPQGNKAAAHIDQRASTMSETRETGSSRRGMRAVSDAVTGRERAFAATPEENILPSESTLMQSPTEASASPGSSTTFADANKSEFSTPQQSYPSSAARRKPKKQTSAYTRGLLKVGPQEQAIGADYSGWMKKKSSNLMTTWKPRYFVLKGRRLSYYYSETDTEEKGLIDISNHRVLPANNDFLTGLHATLTGANSPSPTSPNTPSTIGSNPYSNADPSMNGGAGDKQPFIFKLVPPRSGLSKGVNFTKPSVHYFAASTRSEGRFWMGALMKSTIDRDETNKVVTTYQQKTITLEQARARRELPPFLKGVEEEQTDLGAQEENRVIEQMNGSADDGGVNQEKDDASSIDKPGYSGIDPSTTTDGTSTFSMQGAYESPGLQKVEREGPADLPQIMTNLESNGVTEPKSAASRTSKDRQGLGIQGLSSGAGSQPTSPIIDRMKSAGMW